MPVLYLHNDNAIRHQGEAHFVAGLHAQTVSNGLGDCGLALTRQRCIGINDLLRNPYRTYCSKQWATGEAVFTDPQVARSET